MIFLSYDFSILYSTDVWGILALSIQYISVPSTQKDDVLTNSQATRYLQHCLTMICSLGNNFSRWVQSTLRKKWQLMIGAMLLLLVNMEISFFTLICTSDGACNKMLERYLWLVGWLIFASILAKHKTSHK